MSSTASQAVQSSAVNVGLYARISDTDPDDVQGVTRQIDDELKLCDLRNWNPKDRYIDNIVSAFKKKIRPEFERMVSDLQAGIIDGVVGYNLDRLWRQPKDLERLIDIYDEAKRKGRKLVFATVEGDIDLTSDDGITMARVMVAMANKESRNTARRVARKRLELAQSGKPGGGPRPFGWLKGGVELDLEESELIVSAADFLLAGGTVADVVGDWNAAMKLTPRGNLWTRKSARDTLRNPRLAGFSVYRGEVFKDPEGNPVRGCWKPILTVEQWEAVCARLPVGAAPERMLYLLSGLLRCACGKMMYGTSRGTARSGHRYRCTAENGGCGKNNISGVPLEQVISELVDAALKGKAAPESPVEWAGEDRVKRLHAKNKEMMDAFNSDILPAGIVFPQIKANEDEIKKLRKEKAAAVRTGRVFSNLDEMWASENVNRRREVLRHFFLAFVVQPAGGRTGPKFDYSRVTPVPSGFGSPLQAAAPSV